MKYSVDLKKNKMEVVKFTIELSTENNESFVLVAETKDSRKFVVAGNLHFPTYLTPYEHWFYRQ